MEYMWKDRKRTFCGLPWSFTKYMLTEDRLFISRGFFTVKEDEVRLYRITDVALKMTLGQRIFGIGTISCCSADKSLGDFEIKNIKKPREVKEMLSTAIEKERINKRVFSKEDFPGHDHHGDGDFDDNDED
ncbi:MAG: PH domain-containing protein [Lachnospiraceae bacterium]